MLAPYVNGGCLTSLDVMLSVLAPGLPFRLNAARVARAAWSAARQSANEFVAPSTIAVGPYNGANPHVLAMRDFLEERLADDLLAAYVHGSLATGEEIAYSDFDALVIIRAEVFADTARLASVARRLNQARGIMLDLDPLQHHGWFALSESELFAYPESYLPSAVLRYAKALLPGAGHVLTVKSRPRPHEGDGFAQLIRRIRLLTETGRRPRNLYELKVLLSNIMLLPSLYVQERDGAGVFKKHSFDLARADFSPDDWSIMDEVSAIRTRWVQPLAGYRALVLRLHRPGIRRLAKKLAPGIAADLRTQLDERFYERVAVLIDVMSSRLGPVAPE